jgi:hypothetical protein
MSPNDSGNTRPAATWGLIFGLLTSCGPLFGGTVDHTKRPVCEDPNGATVDPCVTPTCVGYLGKPLPDGGWCVLPSATASSPDAGPDARHYSCGFCNG